MDVQQFAELHQSDDDVIADLGAKELTLLIQQLPLGYRIVFNMYVVEGYSHKEIADQLGVSRHVVEYRLLRARQVLRGALTRAQVVEGVN